MVSGIKSCIKRGIGMNKKDAIEQLEMIATNMTGELAGCKDDYADVIVKRIDAIDMGIAALKGASGGEVEVPHYKVGQILKFTEDYYLKGLGDRVKIPKGKKVIIGADGFAYHTDGLFQPLGDAVVEGYDTEGLANYIYAKMDVSFSLNEILEENEITEEDFVSELECALEDIGF